MSTQGWVPDDSTFGARLALVRQRMGWNIKEAGVACVISPESWRRWEAGKTEPKSYMSICMRIAGVTGVDYRWLALGPDGRVPSEAGAMAATPTYRPGRLVATIPTPNARPVVRAAPLRHPSDVFTFSM